MKISVVIPTYNRANTITKSINSVINQTVGVDEIIIVDDGSIDNTKEVVRGIDDRRIRYIKLDENGGQAKARNVGVSVAECDWIAFQDSDDEWNSNKIEIQKKYIEENDGIDIVYSSYLRDDGRIVPLCFGATCYEGYMTELLLQGNTIGAPTMLMKKTLFERIGGFDESMSCLEDWDLAINISINTKIGFVKEPLMLVHIGEERVSDHLDESLIMRCYLIGKYKKYYLDLGLFDKIIGHILLEAKKVGIEQDIVRLLEYYIVSV